MAIIKHIASKNAAYADAVQYLTYRHNEKTGEILHDENDNLLMRENYLIEGINCNPMTYAIECLELNKNCNKNLTSGEIKSHHYILSFDPKDVPDHNLTIEKAQELGMQFANKFFKGHQVLVCTHPDGDNGAGNIHVHIVLNSLKKFDVKKEDFMEKNCEHKAGFKMRDSAKMMHAIKQYVMDMCKENGLYQQDLFAQPQEKVPDKEYRNNQRQQEKLDKKNKKLEDEGFHPKNTEYISNKSAIRKAILSSAYKAENLDEFKKYLSEKGIELKESRGKWSYKTQEMTKPIRARQLGKSFEKEAVMMKINEIKEVINVAENPYASKSRRYSNKLHSENIQRKAATLTYMDEHGLKSASDIRKRMEILQGRIAAKNSDYKEVKKRVNELNELIRNTGAYYATKRVYSGLSIAPNPVAYRTKNEADIYKHEQARAFLKKYYNGQKMLKVNDIKQEIAGIYDEFDRKYEEAQFDEEEFRQLESVLKNYEAIVGKEPEGKDHRQQKNNEQSL